MTSIFGLAALLVAAACGGGDTDGAARDAGMDTAGVQPMDTASDESARVTFAPAPDDSLPRAVLGTAPAPQGRPLRYFAQDSATRGYLALPDDAGPHPAVILIHEWDGLNDRIRQTADAMAAEGYVALAADLYSGRTGDGPQENMALVREIDGKPQFVIDNLNAAVSYLRQRDDVTGRVATIGWCFGGGVALSYALGGENHDGTAMFYGSVVTDPDSLAALDHEIYGTFAGMDENIPPAQVEQFVDALREAGVPNEVHIYDDVRHGFWLWVDEDPQARRTPALDAWQRLKAYLQRTVRGGAS